MSVYTVITTAEEDRVLAWAYPTKLGEEFQENSIHVSLLFRTALQPLKAQFMAERKTVVSEAYEAATVEKQVDIETALGIK